MHPITVQITCAFWRDEVRSFFEPTAPSVQSRLSSLKSLSDEGTDVELRLDPLFPSARIAENVRKHGPLSHYGVPEAQTQADIIRLVRFAKDAGVTRGAIYWHFGNKENLLIELVKERADSYFTVISEVFEKEITPLEKINAILVNLTRKMESDDQFKTEDIMMIHRADIKGRFRPINEYIQQRATEYSKLLARIIIEGQQKGEIRSEVEPQHIVSLLFVFIGGFAKLKMRRHAPSLDRPDSAELVDLFLKGITAHQ